MEVIFSAPQKFGDRKYKKGQQHVSDNLAYDAAFKKLVVSGAIKVLPRNEVAQSVIHSKNAKALFRAQSMRVSQSTQAVPDAVSPPPSAAVPVQAVQVLAQSISKADEKSANAFSYDEEG